MYASGHDLYVCLNLLRVQVGHQFEDSIPFKKTHALNDVNLTGWDMNLLGSSFLNYVPKMGFRRGECFYFENTFC